MLYQRSYYRVWWSFVEAKLGIFFVRGKVFADFFVILHSVYEQEGLLSL